uniref:Uncharacterized protein n=1 Tax=Anguilla anguilla TaxID=7936 RepID=A0A0E9TF78_ANGAN
MSVIDCEVSVSLIVCVVVLVPVHWFYPLHASVSFIDLCVSVPEEMPDCVILSVCGFV